MKRTTKNRINLSIIFPGLKEKTSQLTYCQNFPYFTAEQSAQTNMIKREDIIIISETNIKCTADLGVLCNLEDLDFIRAIYPTTYVNKSLTVIRPQLHINHRYVWSLYAKTERASIIIAAGQRIRSDLPYFFMVFVCWRTGFL